MDAGFLFHIFYRQHYVTGVDISPTQIKRAKHLVPNAKFICADMCEVDFPDSFFSAVVCLYSIIHVPMEEQPVLIKDFSRWLKPNGYLLISISENEWTGQKENWLGVEGGTMYWSYPDQKTYMKWLNEAGFSTVWERFIPEGESGHPLVFMQKSTREKNHSIA